MRKWFTWCLLTAVAFVGSGCSDDDDGGQVKLAFSKRTAVFGAGGGAVSINVDAAGAWSAAQPEAGWLEVEYDATSMRLHAEANPSPEVRQAEVVVTTGDYTATIDVAQEPAEPVTLDVKGPESYVFDSEGGEILLSVASNAAWTASVDQTWCVLSTDPERGLATLTVAEPNTGDKTLTATLTVEAGTEVNGAKQTFSLSQQMRGENPYFRIPGYADAPRPAERGGVGTRRRGGRDGGRRVRRADVDGGGRAERGRNARNRGDAQSGADSGLRIAAERFDRNRLQL